jgi:CorA-like Mg2+ transporter protein
VQVANSQRVALVWLDSGKDLSEGPWGPWLNPHGLPYGKQNHCHPIIQHRPKGALLPGEPEPQPNETPASKNFAQNVTLLPVQYGSTLDPSLVHTDPMYALSELFAFAGSSESQFLNLVQAQIQRDVEILPHKMEHSVANLRHRKTLLDEHIERLRTTVEILRNRDMLDWPKQVQSPLPMEDPTVEKALYSLLLDYEHLLDRATNLSEQCVGGTNIIMNSAMLAESQKSIIQAKGVAKLTLLAYLFLPLPFTTSFFGMNFLQLGSGKLSMWWLVAVLVPIQSVSVAVLYWDHISPRLKRTGRKRRR